MGRAPCCDKANVKKGPWSPEEDAKLKSYIDQNGTGGNWIALPQKIGLKRCGKSCRLRWLNYLQPNIRHGGFSEEEDNLICNLYISIGSRWSIIAAQLPGRTDNDIKNYWNTRLKKKLLGKQRKEQQALARRNCSIKKENENFTLLNNIDPACLMVNQFSTPYWPDPSIAHVQLPLEVNSQFPLQILPTLHNQQLYDQSTSTTTTNSPGNIQYDTFPGLNEEFSAKQLLGELGYRDHPEQLDWTFDGFYGYDMIDGAHSNTTSTSGESNSIGGWGGDHMIMGSMVSCTDHDQLLVSDYEVVCCQLQAPMVTQDAAAVAAFEDPQNPRYYGMQSN